ncbi:protein kinase domain-containing protein [Hyalangium versicolor]|uniref:protein kinase domain-containing protein n=1 Tax=Hyalangium versicolor TaxID=2861190 RepID=UPI001CCB9880|nr:protein kinase [Hyalangium versicolor]
MGTYRIVQKLAAGGMAEVFLGKVVGAEGFEKPVAVKRILPSYVQDAAFNELFLREAKVSMLLQHANVVQVLDLGTVGGQYYMVMEFVEGENLRALMRASRTRKVSLGLREVCFITQQVADALAYAHSRTDASGAPLNIVHRDVNPSNVMIGINGEVKLADFGIAKVADGHIETEAGVLKGKINYLAPEQVLSKPVDQRSDIFLLGLLLYELIAGKQLLEGTHLQIVQRLGSFNERALEPLPGVPAPLWAILQRALAASPSGRFRTAREFSEALQNFLFDHRLRVGPGDIAALFSRAFPERRSPLEDLVGVRGEEIHLDGRDTPRGAPPPVLRPEPRRQPGVGNPPVLRPQTLPPLPARNPYPPPQERVAPEPPTRVLPPQDAQPVPQGKPVPRPGRKRIGDILVARGSLPQEWLDQALVIQRRKGGKLGQILIGEKLLDGEELVRALSEQSGLPHISDERLQTMAIPEDLIKLMPMEQCEKLCTVPVVQRGRELYCAMLEPRDLKVLDAVKFAAGAVTVHGLFATESAIRRAIRRFYGSKDEEVFLGDVGNGDTTMSRERVLNFVERFTGRGAYYIDGEALEAQAQGNVEASPPSSPAPTPTPAPAAQPVAPPTPAPIPPARMASAANMPRARMVLVVSDASDASETAVQLLLQQGIAAATSPAASAEKALSLGGYDLALVLESAIEEPGAVAERLRASHPDVAVRLLPSFSAALLGEGGPLERLLATQARLLESSLAMLGGSGGLAPLLVKLTRRCAARLGASSVEELLAGTVAAALLLAARLEEPSHFVLPSLEHARTLVGNELPEVSETLGAVLTEGAHRGPPAGRAALAVLSAVAFVLQTQSAQPTPKEAAEALSSLRNSPRLTPAALEALALELGIGMAGSGSAPRIVVAESDTPTAMTLQLRLMAEGLVMQRARTLPEVERALAGAQAAILESPLPEGDVFAFIENLRAAPATARFPIFLIVGREDHAVVTAGLDAGADDVLVRPVNIEVLMAKLRRAISHRPPAQRV